MNKKHTWLILKLYKTMCGQEKNFFVLRIDFVKKLWDNINIGVYMQCVEILTRMMIKHKTKHITKVLNDTSRAL